MLNNGGDKMKKKKVLIFIVLIIILFAATLLYVKFKNMPMTVYYNDTKMYLFNEPIKEEDTAYLPAKSILIGIYGEDNEIKYSRDYSNLEVLIDESEILITAGSKKVSVNGNEKEYSMPAIVENDVFLIPMEFLDAFNLKTEYSSLTNKVKITGDEPVKKERYDVEENKEKDTYTYTVDGVSYTYDKKMNLVHRELNGDWISYSYDNNDNLEFYSTSEGEEGHFTYDEEGNLISQKNQDHESINSNED